MFDSLHVAVIQDTWTHTNAQMCCVDVYVELSRNELFNHPIFTLTSKANVHANVHLNSGPVCFNEQLRRAEQMISSEICVT